MEDYDLVLGRDARAGVIDRDGDFAGAQARPNDHPTGRRVLDRIGDQVLQHAPEHAAIGTDPQFGPGKPQRQPLGLRHRLELDAQLVEHRCQRHSLVLGLQPAGVDPRHLDQRREDLLDRHKRGIELVDQMLFRRRQFPLDEARGVEPGRIQRLQDVVARRGNEAGLVEARRLGPQLGIGKFGVGAHKLEGPLVDAPLQRFVGPCQGRIRQHAMGDVGKCDDDPALRHWAGADFEDAGGRQFPLVENLLVDRKLQDPVADDLVENRAFEPGPARRHPQQRIERSTELYDLVGQVHQLAERPVPTHQPHVLVEHCQTVTHLIERRLQQVAVELQGLARVVE